ASISLGDGKQPGVGRMLSILVGVADPYTHVKRGVRIVGDVRLHHVAHAHRDDVGDSGASRLFARRIFALVWIGIGRQLTLIDLRAYGIAKTTSNFRLPGSQAVSITKGHQLMLPIVSRVFGEGELLTVYLQWRTRRVRPQREELQGSCVPRRD